MKHTLLILTHLEPLFRCQRGDPRSLVGNGQQGDVPDGNDPFNCQLARPHGVFIGDSEAHRVCAWRK